MAQQLLGSSLRLDKLGNAAALRGRSFLQDRCKDEGIPLRGSLKIQ